MHSVQSVVGPHGRLYNAIHGRQPRLVTTSRPEGITHPSIDELLQTTESKYSLVIYAARRARQINSYFTPTEGMLQFVGPLVDFHQQEKALSIALREIHTGSVRVVSAREKAQAAQDAAEVALAEESFGDPLGWDQPTPGSGGDAGSQA
jgi:DNA-directed RNA polymerase subunit omega